ncbi:MAG: F0F1 ATP synthase subunit gamma [Candidatus Omnitrophica bacterium]|nr:F0F1 ATP synthase subunit gamma [Candidatus Omnitrophota bacterium]
MIPITQLKQDLEFNKSLGEIIEVLKIAASIQLRQFQAKEKPSKEFFEHFEGILGLIDSQQARHPLLFSKEKGGTCVVVITPNEGFAGELNTLLVNAALDSRKDIKNDGLVVLGERGASYLEEMDESFVYFPGLTEDIKPKQVEGLEEYIINEYLKGKINKVIVIYAHFLTITSHKIERIQLLPCSSLFKEKTASYEKIDDLLIEPSFNKVVEGMVRLWLRWTIYNIFWSSKLSELASRLMHLEGSSQELTNINRKLALQYFKHVHAIADKSIREISASRLVRR